MASGKMSPRQKMINMMYLVLIALLALNVSKEILKAFHLMEVSFENAKDNIDEKNQLVMQTFEIAKDENPKRATEWFNKAAEVRQIAKEFDDYINEVKKTIIDQSGGRKERSADEPEGALTETMVPDNMEKHANYFEEGSGKGGQGKVLQARIEQARMDMIKVLDHPRIDKSVRETLERNSALRAEDPPQKGASKKTWSSSYLVHSPLAGVAALLSKIQSDAKNLEAEILNILINQVDASTIKFDAVEAKIIASSSYIMAGQEYEADIVLMALNTTAQPKIVVNNQQIPVEGGKGKYKVTAPNSAGFHTVEGYIEVDGPDGVEKKEFKTEWQSFQPAATISADAMNVLYIGLENPISVSVPGFPANDVTASISSGSLTKTTGSGKYIAKVQRVQGMKTTITANVRLPDGSSRSMGKMEYRIREVPNPEPLYGNLPGGKQPKGALRVQSILNASMGSFAFEGVNFKVTGFEAMLVPKGGQPKIASVTGNSLAQVNSMVAGARSGDRIIIAEIKAIGPGGIRKNLPAMVIDIQ